MNNENRGKKYVTLYYQEMIKSSPLGINFIVFCYLNGFNINCQPLGWLYIPQWPYPCSGISACKFFTLAHSDGRWLQFLLLWKNVCSFMFCAIEFLESNFSSHCTILLRIKEICSCGKSSFSGSSAHELWQVAGCCCWGAPTSGWFFKGFFKGDTWGRSSFNSRSRSGRTTGKGSHSGMLYGKDWIEKLWTRSRSSSNPNPSFSVVSEI
jgi:hypothetical protein